MFLDRTTRRPVRLLEWRIRLLGVGAILAFVGMYFDARWMVWIAIGVLVVGFLLRLVPRRIVSDRGEGHDDTDEPASLSETRRRP